MLPVVILLREYSPGATLGSLVLPSGRVLHTMERPWLNNAASVSCVPEGQYLVKWLPRSASGRYRRVWHVQDVPGRVGILFHTGNIVEHSLGCILPGMRRGSLVGQPAVLSSATALNEMRAELEGQDFILVIRGTGLPSTE